MNKDQLERLPRSKRLLNMGRQKILKTDHLKRTEVIKRELSKLESDVQSLKRNAKNDKRYNLEILLADKKGQEMLP